MQVHGIYVGRQATLEAAQTRSPRKGSMFRQSLIISPPISPFEFLQRGRHRFMDTKSPEEVVFQGKQVQQDAVEFPPKSTHRGTGHGVQNEMVGSRDNGGQDDKWISKAHGQADESAP